jgi:outer membrane protein OmpA-like peptidoglycan-associated protein
LTLAICVGGYTDNIGGEELNQKLSEKRAESVRTYLVAQGLTDGSVASQGFGMTMPVADNATADGRQKNRRVEIVVSGEAIGAKIGN